MVFFLKTKIQFKRNFADTVLYKNFKKILPVKDLLTFESRILCLSQKNNQVR